MHWAVLTESLCWRSTLSLLKKSRGESLVRGVCVGWCEVMSLCVFCAGVSSGLADDWSVTRSVQLSVMFVFRFGPLGLL